VLLPATSLSKQCRTSLCLTFHNFLVIVILNCKSLKSPWIFPNGEYIVLLSQKQSWFVFKNSERLFKYVHVTVGVVSQAFIWLFIYYTVLEIKSPYFKCLTSKPVSLVALLNHWLLIKITITHLNVPAWIRVAPC